MMGASTKAEADRLGLTGWVCNREDGSVEIHAEGTEEALNALERWCQRGPSGAEVTHVEANAADEEGCTSFQIHR